MFDRKKLVNQLPDADGLGLTSRRTNQTRVEEMVRNSQNFFDLYEMALVQKKSTICKFDTSQIRFKSVQILSGFLLNQQLLGSRCVQEWCF